MAEGHQHNPYAIFSPCSPELAVKQQRSRLLSRLGKHWTTRVARDLSAYARMYSCRALEVRHPSTQHITYIPVGKDVHEPQALRLLRTPAKNVHSG